MWGEKPGGEARKRPGPGMPYRNGARGFTSHQEEAVLAFTSFVPSFIPQTPLEPLPCTQTVFSQVGKVPAQGPPRPSDFGISRIGGPLCT